MYECVSPIQFRFVLSEDIDQLQSLYEECFPVQYPDSWFQDLITNPMLIAFVAVVNDRVIGVLVARFMTLADCNLEDQKILDGQFSLNTCVAYILSIGITESFRCKGLASTLLNAFLYYASGCCYNDKWSSSLEDQHQTLNFVHDKNCINASGDFDSIEPLLPRLASPDDRPAHYNETYPSLGDIVDLLPPLPPVCRAIFLHVLCTNSPARRFYEKYGFHAFHIQRNCYTIAGQRADGYTYLFHTNGGYAKEPSQVISYPTPNGPVCGQPLSTSWLPAPVNWVFQVIFRLSQTVLYKLSTSFARVYSPQSSSATL